MYDIYFPSCQVKRHTGDERIMQIGPTEREKALETQLRHVENSLRDLLKEWRQLYDVVNMDELDNRLGGLADQIVRSLRRQ